MISIYHNPRCKKSREGLTILEDSGQDFETLKYLDDTPSPEDLKIIIKKMGIKPIELVRKQEQIWKEKFKSKDLSDSEIIEALHDFPKLIERPIVINGEKAIIGRPPEDIKGIL
ncbi:arsenate reductase (glutaredoxin) [Psychroflexus gondwanensis]|uniref:Glutaredoxin (Arsenate reductase) ArsC n=1 Tax=Psychroflexus gondwanensis ACAM 44 TaxID=1189619 RepID=N1WNB5_9FLAO|nr:arsenate reductase (glutaredoxin) [Psychroflexus gondwanensis]EMY81786.1 glutaredoxin (arsenate reductase) ArsC [Psychroflexus gondwanensis ACAM 44]TXE20893.1 arsenate reductase (glutaredoxin) [Psychroflexus gondwanensis]